MDKPITEHPKRCRVARFITKVSDALYMLINRPGGRLSQYSIVFPLLYLFRRPETIRHLIPRNIADVPSGTDIVALDALEDFQGEVPHGDAFRQMRPLFTSNWV